MHYMKNSESKNRTNVLDMTTGNPYSLMLRFAMPVFLSEVFQQLYNTADAFIVGRYLGTNALAAVTSSGNLIFLLVSFFMGTAMGGGVDLLKLDDALATVDDFVAQTLGL